MKPSAIHPRPDQISELTRGLRLPLPELQSDYLEIIAEGFLLAYEDIRKHSPVVTVSGSEAEITALMEARLNRLIDQDPFWGQLVLCVARGKESLSFNGANLEKRPDLSIYLTSRDRAFPLIVEAKIVDDKAGKSEQLYCDKGVCRFLKGEYAWGNVEAFMIAYVRDGSSIGMKLTPFLTAALGKSPTAYSVEALPVSITAGGCDLARSRHGRAFQYTHQDPPSNLPGSIDLWHLWLS